MKLERAWLFVASIGLAAVHFIGCSDEPTAQNPTSSASGSSGNAGGGGAGGNGSGGASSSGSSSGMPPECSAATDCKNNGPADFCGEPECANGKCGRKGLQAPGVALPSQLYGDCEEKQCDATFNIATISINDAYDDAKECTTDLCTNGVLTHEPVAQGTLCTQSNGGQGVCDGSGACVTCIDGVQGCTGTFVCQMNKCVGNKCANSTKDPGEGDIDCGGTCLPCAEGQTCTFGTQCASGICGNGMCVAPACPDGAINGKETGLDCGGADCPKCTTDDTCAISSDCQSGVCKAGFCIAPTCTDAVQNGDEKGIDCGGSCPNPCP